MKEIEAIQTYIGISSEDINKGDLVYIEVDKKGQAYVKPLEKTDYVTKLL